MKATTWARSLASPRERLLPGLGARLERRPELAAATLVALQRAPGRERVLVLLPECVTLAVC